MGKAGMLVQIWVSPSVFSRPIVCTHQGIRICWGCRGSNIKAVIYCIGDLTSDRVPKERLGTSRLNHVFLKIYPYDYTSTFMQSRIKICKTDFAKKSVL